MNLRPEMYDGRVLDERKKVEKHPSSHGHYDSVYGWDFEKDIPKGGVSFRASDHEYGVAVFLEAIRAIQSFGMPLLVGNSILLSCSLKSSREKSLISGNPLFISIFNTLFLNP